LLEDSRDRREAERAQWHAERSQWQARFEEQHRHFLADAERRLEEQRGRFEAERQSWREQADVLRGFEREAGALQKKIEKLRGAFDAARQERDELRARVERLEQQRGKLGAWLDEVQAECRESDRAHREEIERLTLALEEALSEAEAAQRQAEQVRSLQDELARERHGRETLERRHREELAARRREWESERRGPHDVAEGDRDRQGSGVEAHGAPVEGDDSVEPLRVIPVEFEPGQGQGDERTSPAAQRPRSRFGPRRGLN